MSDVNHRMRAAGHPFGLALLLLGSAAAQAEGAPEARQRVYQQDRQLCLSGHSNQDQATCLREAGAARQQNTAAQTQPSAEEMAANAVRRCDVFGGDARQSCLARMQGQGSVTGSAAAGGILRELTEPAP
jgi:hypothetical protein